MDDKEKAKQLKNKIHLLTFFITKCEEEDPLEEDEDEWHPDFEEAIAAALKVNEHGYLDENELHEFNDLCKKWANRFRKLGLDEVPLREWKEERNLEPEIYSILKTYMNENDS